MSNKYSYNRNAAERKALVDTISRILEKPAVYLGAPTFAYAVGDYRISRKGSLSSMNDAGQEEMQHLVLCLQEQRPIWTASLHKQAPAPPQRRPASCLACPWQA